ncbi:MAG: hypothetical protein HDR01_13425 [Lachnospiraceae bacterium]|nr:hypothetical protein [Lachnospiraceae bacterium]
MARGQRKTIEEKIEAKEEEIRLLKIRIKKEEDELEALISEKKAKDIDFLYNFISEANLSPQEATGILEEHLQGNYEETA